MSIRNELLEQILAAISSGGDLTPEQIDAINSILSLTDNTIPLAIGGELADSSISETPTDIVMTKTLIVPQNSLFIGPAVKLSDEGGFLGIANLADGLDSVAALSRTFETEAERDSLFPDTVPKLGYQFLLPAKWVYQFPFTAETSSANSVSFELEDSDSTLFRMMRLYSLTALTGVRIFVENLLGSGDALVWQNVTVREFENGEGQVLSAGGFSEVDMGFVKVATANIRLRLTIQAQPGDTLELTGENLDLGFGPYFYPQMRTYTQDIFEMSVPDFHALIAGRFGQFDTPLKLDSSTAELRSLGDSSDNIIQPVFTEAITDGRPEIEFTNGDIPIVLNSITVKHDGTWEPVQVSFADLRTVSVSLVDGDNIISAGPSPLTIEAGETIAIRFTGAIGSGSQSQISLLGDVSQIPYYSLNTTDVLGDQLMVDGSAVTFKAESGSTYSKGALVYIAAYNSVTNLPRVAESDIDASFTHPVAGLLTKDVVADDEVLIITNGLLTGVDTSLFSPGDELFLSILGEWTTTPPDNYVQSIGTVAQSAFEGSILVNVNLTNNTTAKANLFISDELRLISTASSQEPSSLDTPITINFNPSDITSANGFIDYNATTDKFIFNKGIYRAGIIISYGRTGAGGISNLYFTDRVAGVENDISFFARLDSDKTGIPASLSTLLIIPTDGVEVDFIFWRDSGDSGVNSGGLFQNVPARVGGKACPSATINIHKIG